MPNLLLTQAPYLKYLNTETEAAWNWKLRAIGLGLKTWDSGVSFEGFQLNACDWRDMQVAIEVLQLKGVGTEGLGLKGRI